MRHAAGVTATIDVKPGKASSFTTPAPASSMQKQGSTSLTKQGSTSSSVSRQGSVGMSRQGSTGSRIANATSDAAKAASTASFRWAVYLLAAAL